MGIDDPVSRREFIYAGQELGPFLSLNRILKISWKAKGMVK